ncbi:predicted protein [Lichtheimia corymbifera JMRC:FSU:9682]|uniref:Potassium channel domain-containing protein n=1 Tax=Lichtheimia corymbifera JMRC:FSU:9682 TaxID=1263082 RepID=A0A068S682_9FUNG|nr:predicted protein [Lichtheimia corymbifera JMRC:FSU:9682]
MPIDDNGATPYTTSPTSLSPQQEDEPLTWDGRRAAIHFSLPEHPVAHTGYSFIQQEPSSPPPSLWERLENNFYRFIDIYNRWLEERKQQMHNARQLRGRSRSLTEIPFCMAAFISIYATFMLFRGLAVDGWIVDHHNWDGTGHSFDRNAVAAINAQERTLVTLAVVCGVITWMFLIGKTRSYIYRASRWCILMACIQGLSSLLAVMAFSQRCSDKGMDDPQYVYSRGFWSCLVSGTLMLVATFGFILDWLLSYPYSELTPAINALVLPAVMVCSVVAIGASVYALLEDWTYSEALIFCWTAVTTIGYGDIAPSTSQGKIFFLLYTAAGVSVVGYMLLSIRAVITGSSSDILKVNLMRVESLHDYSHRQHQKWLARHDAGVSYPQSGNNRRPTFNNNRARRRLSSNVSTFSNYTISNIINNKDRQILVQVITRSGVVRMTFTLILCWFGGAGVFCLLEHDWSYLDALYFAFCTQLTIGFGDIVPQSVLAQEFWLVYIVISIAVAAYFISLFGDALVEKLHIQYGDDDDGGSEYDDSIDDPTGNEPSYITLARSFEDDDDNDEPSQYVSETPESIHDTSNSMHSFPTPCPRPGNGSVALSEREPLVRYASMPNVDRGAIRRPPRLGIYHSPTRYMSYDSTQETTPIIHQPTPLPPPLKHPYSPSDISAHTENGEVSAGEI